jgi:hypothetical protein
MGRQLYCESGASFLCEQVHSEATYMTACPIFLIDSRWIVPWLLLAGLRCVLCNRLKNTSPLYLIFHKTTPTRKHLN